MNIKYLHLKGQEYVRPICFYSDKEKVYGFIKVFFSGFTITNISPHLSVDNWIGTRLI